MTGSNALLEKLQKIKGQLMEKYPIERMALCGSYARNEQKPDSDVDIIVSFNGRIGIRFIDLAEELEDYLNLKVDLISEKGIKQAYFERIKEELIYV